VTDNQLFYGDNLEVLAKLPSESVHLVYLDPPFNSARNYNVIFAQHGTTSDAGAQIQAFEDTWTWTQATEDEYQSYIAGAVPNRVAEALTAFRTLLGDNDALAYLVNMAPRLVHLHRVLKPTGSLYLHCDPTMSHYLKVLLDAVFGARYFRGNITWVRTTTHNDAKRWSPNSDVILYYGKSDKVTWNPAYSDHDPTYVETKYRHLDSDGRRYRLDNMTSPNPRPNLTYEWNGHAPPANGWRYSKETMAALDEKGLIWYPDSKSKRPQLKRYLDEQKGVVIGDVWTDISPINSRAAERLGYPTQKPLTLLERIIAASSNPGDVVLDPFCGCGTTVDAAQKLGRRWIGIDITYIAVDLIEKRLQHTYGDAIKNEYSVSGIPRDAAAAQALFQKNPFDFERWAVSQVGGQPNEKQVGDKGIDGVARFPIDGKTTGRILVSVKGGKTINPSMARDLEGTLAQQKAELGVLIMQSAVTKGVQEVADKSGSYKHPHYGQSYPRLQVITVAELLEGKKPNLPPTFLPYIAAAKAPKATGQTELF
jgi:DNA modification methylase